jgi:hypothetical protein
VIDDDPTSAPPVARSNRFDRMEWAGALGDLGTLIPSVVAYLAMLGLDPLGVLLSFGVAMIACPVPHRRATDAGRLRAQQGQGRTVRHRDHRGARGVERGHRVRRRLPRLGDRAARMAQALDRKDPVIACLT